MVTHQEFGQLLFARQGRANLAILYIVGAVRAGRRPNPLPVALCIAVRVEFALAVDEGSQDRPPAVRLQLLEAVLRGCQCRVQLLIGRLEFRVQAGRRRARRRAILQWRGGRHAGITPECGDQCDRRLADLHHILSFDACMKPKNYAEPRRTRRKSKNEQVQRGGGVKSVSTVREPVHPSFAAQDNQPTKTFVPRIFLSLVLPPFPPCPPWFNIFLMRQSVRTISHHRATRSTVASAPGRPTTCRLTGRPLLDFPQAIDSAGKPQKLTA